jgi:hypothetical protein
MIVEHSTSKLALLETRWVMVEEVTRALHQNITHLRSILLSVAILKKYAKFGKTR